MTCPRSLASRWWSRVSQPRSSFRGHAVVNELQCLIGCPDDNVARAHSTLDCLSFDVLQLFMNFLKMYLSELWIKVRVWHLCPINNLLFVLPWLFLAACQLLSHPELVANQVQLSSVLSVLLLYGCFSSLGKYSNMMRPFWVFVFQHNLIPYSGIIYKLLC